METAKKRLLDNILKDENGCWIWQKSRNSTGYGTTSFNGKSELCHRMAYQIYIGEIPEKHVVMHTVCDNPPCANPDHLKLGTQKENLDEMRRKNRQNVFDFRKIKQQGSFNPQSKINEETAKNIKNLIKLGHGPKYISDQLNVSVKIVDSIKYCNAWSHVTL